jgi:hypothetical protein
MASKKGKDNTVKGRRKVQSDEIARLVPVLNQKLQDLKSVQKQTQLLKSVGGALYGEMDKLSKKAPAEEVTELGLGEVNNFLAQVKTLGKDDPFIQRLKEFVAAGQQPQNRDVVLVLKLALQGLDRINESVSPLVRSATERVREASAVELALDYYLQYQQMADQGAFEANDVELPDEWETYDHKFDYERLDRTDIGTYFAKDFKEANEETDDESGE